MLKIFFVEYKEKEYYQINIVCLSPTAVCKSRLNTMKTFIGFSATISPFSYYSNILGLDDASKFSLPSSLPKEHLKVIIANNFDTRYYSREAALPNILDLFNKLQEYKKGKYIFFFPSYEFLNQFKNYLMKNAIMSESEVIIQSVNDDNEDRKVFINTFLQNSGPLTGLAILGGIYSEGIDFTGNSLDGVIILGTGIANPGHTEETRKKYYDHLGVNGFDYVFRFPGMTRVVQAAGRVIRSKYDKGFVILADFRFSKQKYRELMPVTWDCLKSDSNKQTIELLRES